MAKTRKSVAKEENVVTSDQNTLRFPKQSNPANDDPQPDQDGPRSNWRLQLIVLLIGMLISFSPFWLNVNYTRMYENVKEQLNLERFNINKPTCLQANLKLLSQEELARHTKASERIWLAFLGQVFDVTEGKFYHPGGSYAFFAGRDGTRAFLSGEFVPSELVDDISDLEESQLEGVETWLSMYHEKYKHLGYLQGSYYDHNACPTHKLNIVQAKLAKLKHKDESNENEKNAYPPCNSEWIAAENRGRLWCSTLSGGVSRTWTGRPRMFYELANKKWRCACIQDDQVEHTLCPKDGVHYADAGSEEGAQCRIKMYENCDPQSIECSIKH